MAAATDDILEAQWNIGFLYLSGMNVHVPKDIEKAVYWLTKSADKGDAPSQFNLYLAHRDGEGIPQ